MSDYVSQGDDRIVCCPNPDCSWHDPGKIPKGEKWYRKHGYYESAQHGRIRRYICLKCHKTFSERTCGDDSYYLHFDDIDVSELGRAWLAGEPLKVIAARNGITVGMVRTRLRRLSSKR